MSNRQEIPFKTLWAENAETTIPATPVIGDSYRDEATTDVTVGDGWAYGDPVPSQSENQYNYIQSLVARQLSEQGILSYSDKEDYSASVGAIVMDDGLPYLCLQDNGPASSVKQPSTEPTYWRNINNIGTVKQTIITVSDPAWEPDPNSIAIKFTPIGGGGGAGGIDGQGAGTSVAGNAGSGGGFTTKTVSGTDIEPSYALTVGAGGIGGASGANDGTSGGDTTVTSTNVNLTAPGGVLGVGITGTSGNQTGPGRFGGVGSGGDIDGMGTSSTSRSVVGGVIATTSTSGFCPIVGGGAPSVSNGNGNNATKFGEGGGAAHQSGTSTNYSGGDGYQGAILIEELF